MIPPDLLDWLDSEGRKRRSNPNEVFGGIQILAVGDFGHIPPIVGKTKCSNLMKKEDPSEHMFGIRFNGGTPNYAFQSVFWREAKFKNVVLAKIHRQSNPLLLRALDELGDFKHEPARKGVKDVEHSKRWPNVATVVFECSRDLALGEEKIVTCLHSRNDLVNEENLKKLTQLPGKPLTFKASHECYGAHGNMVDLPSGVLHDSSGSQCSLGFETENRRPSCVGEED